MRATVASALVFASAHKPERKVGWSVSWKRSTLDGCVRDGQPERKEKSKWVNTGEQRRLDHSRQHRGRSIGVSTFFLYVWRISAPFFIWFVLKLCMKTYLGRKKRLLEEGARLPCKHFQEAGNIYRIMSPRVIKLTSALFSELYARKMCLLSPICFSYGIL